MDTVISLLVMSTLVQQVVPEDPFKTSFRALAERVSGDSRIFTGENVRLRCSLPHTHGFAWNYQWFRGSEQLAQSGGELLLWKARVTDSGKFYCRGVRDSLVGNIYTLLSLPLEIDVDGGWAILHVPPHPVLVRETLQVTCRVRGNPPLKEVVLYKDDVEVIRQTGLSPHVHRTNVDLEDQGMYSCRASWDANGRTRSVISVKVPVEVLEVLTQPVLEIVADDNLVPPDMIKLICHLRYSAPAPAPPIHYYFYKNNNRLGPAASENHDLVPRTPGRYSCRAKVPQLDISRWSEPKSFGQVTGPAKPPPPILLWSLAPSVASPDLSLTPPPPHPSTAAPTLTRPAAASTPSSDPPLKLPQPAPSALLPPARSTIQTASSARDTPTVTSSRLPDNLSGDLLEESRDLPGRSPHTVLY